MINPPVLTLADVPDYHRAQRGGFSRWFGRTGLRLLGWHVVGRFPSERKLIVVGAPHTSNWDFVVGILMMFALDIRAYWMGKHTIFRKPFGGLMKRWGGIPVYRDNPVGMAEQMAASIRDSDAMLLTITPEGTRKRVEKWKTGFLRIASAANCGVLLASLDFQKKQIQLGDIFQPGDDPDQDVLKVKDYYRQFHPRHPDHF